MLNNQHCPNHLIKQQRPELIPLSCDPEPTVRAKVQSQLQYGNRSTLEKLAREAEVDKGSRAELGQVRSLAALGLVVCRSGI